MRKLTARLFRIVLRIVALGVTVLATIWVIRGVETRKMPDLQAWHTYEAEHEFRADDYADGISLAEYRELEARLFDEIDANVYAQVGSSSSEAFNRYNKQGDVYAGDDGQAWNRTFTIDVADPAGGILLLHGASDSPYSVRALAQQFADHGLYVAAFRLPGHGTIPNGLKNATVDDLVAITRAGARHVGERIGADKPFYLGGYSTGAALAVNYALDAVLDDALRPPRRLFLYSPSIAVTPFARFTDWDLLLARIPYFEKMAWLAIEPEYDPYKYNSFPANGAFLAYTLSQFIKNKMKAAKKRDLIEQLPPMIAFQSLVDSTVRTDRLVRTLFGKLAENGHELVLFDVNRAVSIQHFIVDSERDLLTELEMNSPSGFAYTLVTNRTDQTIEIEARTRSAGAENFVVESLPLSWPSGVYSLSHVAIPFAITDPWYGAVDANGVPLTKSFNNMAPRGEQAVLAVPLGRLMRLRHNPFFGYVAQRTLEFCEACN